MPPKTPAKLRAAIYARYSSDLQREQSIEDQIESCRRYCAGRGMDIVDVYADAAASGASTEGRPAFQRLREDAEARRFDIVVAESVDRLGRRLADFASLHDRLSFLGIRLHTVSQGEMNPLLAGVMGAVAQGFLSELRDKTRRGLRGKILSGLSAGGIGYGYRTNSERRGSRHIHEAEAAVVRRIFSEYASGRSPRDIAARLNADAVPGPGGRPWGDTTIRGQAARGTGILNNSLYIGRIAWDRCSYVKDPATGKRVARPKPPEEWEVVEAPELRIVDDASWESVKRRQGEMRTEMTRDGSGNALNRAHRATHLLSGLLVCGECGSPYVVVDAYRYGCNKHRSKATCPNGLKVPRQDIEGRVLEALRHRLLQSDAIANAVSQMQAKLRELAAGADARRAELARRISDIEGRIARLVQAIEEGMVVPAIKDRLTRLEAERAAVATEASESNAPEPDIPDAATLASGYRLMMQNLPTLADRTEYPEGTAAWQIVRQAVARITLTPNAERTALVATLHGSFAGIVELAGDAQTLENKEPAAGAAGSELSVVAGAGFEPAAFRL